MKIDRLLTLFPCSSLDDLRLQRDAAEAEELLSAWASLWHPALIDIAQAMPAWFPASQPPQELSGSLVILPECCEAALPEGWLAGCESSEALVLQGLKHRGEMVETALARLGCAAAVDTDVAGDFQALGYCHFVVSVLTQKLRYMTNINEDALRAAVLAAAKAAMQGDVQSARAQLQSAFDRLHEAREYFYPMEASLIDYTLVAPSTLGQPLRSELADGLPRNLLVSGAVLAEMAEREPETLAALKQAVNKDIAAIIGGEQSEVPLPMLSPDAIEFQIRRGLETYDRLLESRPAVFGRRLFGLCPALPGILAKNGFAGAVHFTLDDGQFPVENQSCMRWEGFDETTIEALGRLPLDAGRADSFLGLPERLGNALETEQPAGVIFAHWPGRVCGWYDDLRRIASYSGVLGVFSTLDDYFQKAERTGRRIKYGADRYRSPYLKQDVAAGRTDAVSRWVRYYRRRAVWENAQALYTLAALSAKGALPAADGDLAAELEKTHASVEDSLNASAPEHPELDQRLHRVLETATKRFSQSIGGEAASEHGSASSQGAAQRGYLLANGCSFSRRAGVDLPGDAAPAEVAEPVMAADEHAVVVETPGLGFAWIGCAEDSQSAPQLAKKKGRLFGAKRGSSSPLAEENVLRNEFFEAILDPQSGGIRAILDYRSRQPRLAQQLAMRETRAGIKDQCAEAHYSIMSADEIRVLSPGPICGAVQTSGKIVDREGKRLAGFRQTARIWRGCRVLELDIELDIERVPGPNPWDSYYACRFAWSGETNRLYRDVNLTTQATKLERIEAPHFVEVVGEKSRTAILCGGLPYHRRIGARKLDTLLVVAGETERHFRLGVGIDAGGSMPAALGFVAPEPACSSSASPAAKHGWLFHLDHRNVVTSGWEPIWSEARVQGSGSRVQGPGAGGTSTEYEVRSTGYGARDSTGSGVQGSAEIIHPSSFIPHTLAAGFRVRLQETEGHSAQVGLRSFRQVASARMIGFGGDGPRELAIEADKIGIPVEAYQRIEVEAMFA